MIDKFKNHVSIDNFFTDCNNFKVDKQTYDVSYPEFLKYFSDIKTITKHNLVIGINFTYGWMPTIFDFRSDNFDEAIVFQRELFACLFDEPNLNMAKRYIEKIENLYCEKMDTGIDCAFL